MGRRRAGDFDSLLEAWARWLADSGGSLGGTGLSLLARWMDSKGHMIFSSGGGSREPIDTLEGRIEIAVAEMGKTDQLREDVLRLEYAAGWHRVAVRRGLDDYDPRGLTQLQNALHLGVSVRTYRSRLADARAHVAKVIGRSV